MDIVGAQEFIRQNPRGVMATFRRDGRPALSPVLLALDADGRVVVSTRETAQKVKHLRRDPRVAISVLTERFFGDWIQVEGHAELVSLPAAMDLLVEYYRTLSGEHPDWAEYRSAMVRDQRVIVRFRIERAGPTVSG